MSIKELIVRKEYLDEQNAKITSILKASENEGYSILVCCDGKYLNFNSTDERKVKLRMLLEDIGKEVKNELKNINEVLTKVEKIVEQGDVL